MAWWERDYTESRETGAETRRSFDWPPPATMTLLMLHVLAFAMMFVTRLDTPNSPLRYLMLTGGANHPLAIATHPFTTSGWSIIIVLYATWVLGGRIERRLGTRRLLRLYVYGNLLAGGAYYVAALVLKSPDLVPLTYPVGALAAWCLTAWRHFRDEMVMLWGRLANFGKLAAIAGAIVVGLNIMLYHSASTGWLIAVIAGCVAMPLAETLPIIRVSQPRRAVPARSRFSRLETPATQQDTTSDIDDILAKITEHGLDSLTDEERARLEAARRARLRS
ncbi:MAG: hypothetical protein JXO22_01745 [Phycisphaerae bacterium]|nr:hypothetical protein [Phycisphaerae bacterium]